MYLLQCSVFSDHCLHVFQSVFPCTFIFFMANSLSNQIWVLKRGRGRSPNTSASPCTLLARALMDAAMSNGSCGSCIKATTCKWLSSYTQICRNWADVNKKCWKYNKDIYWLGMKKATGFHTGASTVLLSEIG